MDVVGSGEFVDDAVSMNVGSPFRLLRQGSSTRFTQLSVGRGSCEEVGGLVCTGFFGLSLLNVSVLILYRARPHSVLQKLVDLPIVSECFLPNTLNSALHSFSMPLTHRFFKAGVDPKCVQVACHEVEPVVHQSKHNNL